MHKVYETMLAAFEGLRSLGFPSDDIYAGYAEGFGIMILKTQDKQFVIKCGKALPGTTETKFAKAWERAGKAWNETMTEAEMDRIYSTYMPPNALVSLICTLDELGFKHPDGSPLTEFLELKKPAVAQA